MPQNSFKTQNSIQSTDTRPKLQNFLNLNHKNIFFIKDQIFDKERIKAVASNLDVQKCLLTSQNKSQGDESGEASNEPEASFKTLPMHLYDIYSFGVQSSRQTQEMKFLS